ncbi:hypothetical protein [Thalassobacillus hwangdonensis]|uniref:Uncharacterized protein n=1 Tax=Thalassobacillus hwangdonensis TaxID=546108 RepID=A0ABW3KZW7_9BACI
MYNKSETPFASTQLDEKSSIQPKVTVSRQEQPKPKFKREHISCFSKVFVDEEALASYCATHPNITVSTQSVNPRGEISVTINEYEPCFVFHSNEEIGPWIESNKDFEVVRVDRTAGKVFVK